VFHQLIMSFDVSHKKVFNYLDEAFLLRKQNLRGDILAGPKIQLIESMLWLNQGALGGRECIVSEAQVVLIKKALHHFRDY
jgi:hypothetical protein